MSKTSKLLVVMVCSGSMIATASGGEDAEEAASQAAGKRAFDAANARDWQEVFFDDGTGEWTNKWFLDGESGAVSTGPEGMQLTGGPQFKNDAHQVVLWTRESFKGNLKIEYDYTRLDAETRWVNILYIQATGSGTGPYAEDIAEWNELRRIPAMKMYFDHMNVVHLSYAAFGNVGGVGAAYIRGRRYLPDTGRGLRGTEYVPDYFPPESLFEPGVPHRPAPQLHPLGAV
jgi:hypothetical protein